VTFDEVGIINLQADLVDSGNIGVNYLLSGSSLIGTVNNVGRFYPASLELKSGSIVSRAEARNQSLCIAPSSSYTYLGEEFKISAMLEAQNAAGDVTRNYVDGFAKLANSDLVPGAFYVFEELAGPDSNLSTRRVLGGTPPAVLWPANTDPLAQRGIAALAGNLIFDRQSSGAPDGPFTGLSIGMNTADSDGAALELDIDLNDDLSNDVKKIGTEDFRYGRLLINNAYGPETEPVGIGFTLEYFDANGNFVTNSNDSCTTLFYDASENDPALRSLFYVPLSYQDNLDAGETEVEADAVLADNDVTISVFEGATVLRSGVDSDADNQNDDRPFQTSAPGEGNEGRVLIEFNLNDASLPFSLDFLSYDWRGGVGEADIYDEVPEGTNYTDNPRATVEFGSYRGHDRVINWQEIFTGANP